MAKAAERLSGARIDGELDDDVMWGKSSYHHDAGLDGLVVKAAQEHAVPGDQRAALSQRPETVNLRLPAQGADWHLAHEAKGDHRLANDHFMFPSKGFGLLPELNVDIAQAVPYTVVMPSRMRDATSGF